MAGPKPSQAGMFAKRASRTTLVQNDANSGKDSDIGKFSAETNSYRSNSRRLVPKQNELEKLLDDLRNAFFAPIKEHLLEKLVQLLEKNEQLLEHVIETKKLDKFDINNKWGQSDKLVNLVDRLEKLGYQIRPEPAPALENNLVYLNNHLPRLGRR